MNEETMQDVEDQLVGMENDAQTKAALAGLRIVRAHDILRRLCGVLTMGTSLAAVVALVMGGHDLFGLVVLLIGVGLAVRVIDRHE